MDDLLQLAPSNKFAQPHFDTSQLLPRPDLIKENFPRSITQKKFIILEAQAGQGKTTFAHQLVSHYDQQALWYQIDREDNDPYFFLEALHTCFRQAYKDFFCQQLMDILQAGNLGPLDIKRSANVLLHYIHAYLGDTVYLILEDLHHLDKESPTNEVIEHIFDTGPQKLHYLVTTRTPIQLKCRALLNRLTVSYLFTDDLAFGTSDTEKFLTRTLGKDVSPADTNRIQQITNGWIMGIILASHPGTYERQPPQSRQIDHPLPDNYTHDQLLHYFQFEIFSYLPEELHQSFLKLSFLSEIPADLATDISGRSDIVDHLMQMVEDNHFIWYLESEETTFRLHNLFQEFLQHQALSILDVDERNDILHQEAAYYLRKGQISKALGCYHSAGKLEIINDILREQGLKLLASNRTITINNLLQKIPHEILSTFDWLPLIAGIIQGDFAPRSSLKLLEMARENFTTSADETGELISLAQTIYYHFVVSGLYEKGATLLERTEQLYLKIGSEMGVLEEIMVLRNLASGYCFFTGEMEKAKHYAKRANSLSVEHELKNFMASTRFIQGYIELMLGNFPLFLVYAEDCFTLIQDQSVSTSNRLTMRVMHLCYLSMIGDQINYSVQKQSLLKNIDQEVVKQTVAAPYLYLWDGILQVQCGNIHGAEELLAQGKEIADSSASEHMTSQFLQWAAYIETYKNNDSAKIQEKLELSSKLRAISGGPYYITLHKIVRGVSLLRLGKKREAHKELGQAVALAATHKFIYLSSCGQFFLGYAHLQGRTLDKAEPHFQTAFDYFRKHALLSFWGAHPDCIGAAAKHCMQEGIERAFVSLLAKNSAELSFSDTGEQHLLLKFTLLEGLAIFYNGKKVLEAKQFTAQQRQLLGLILTSPHQQVSVEKVFLTLWPDTPPKKARKSFDALLDRLRGVFRDNTTVPIKTHLQLGKSVLFLQHHQVDTELLFTSIDRGMSAAKDGAWWQAGNHFTHGLSLWRGVLPSDSFANDMSYQLDDQIIKKLHSVAEKWGDHLLEDDRYSKAVELFQMAWDIDKQNDLFVVKLFRTFLLMEEKTKCWEVLERYCQILRTEQYTEEEISSMREEIISRGSKGIT